MSTRRPPCPRCGRTHHAGYARAVGLFGPSEGIRYRAHYPDAPERRTRAEAVQDMCDRYATKEDQ
ncbi:hypothetical protein [Cellulomonas taurus]|uniref:hypothetical protein n=1 Tax=Cellulomonas taurus TaxID=2729175 RepID=UPI00145F1B2B|nr:hypothetical protein [Cellulomonas taurus]